MAGVDNPLFHPRYPRSNAYDPEWVFENQMGPNALWLLESLTEVLPIEPGTRVLDLGCGRAMTSIFLAREFGAEVWATDLWIAAEDNEARIRAAGVEHLVHAVHAEAHQLPFAFDAFDVIVSIDAYQYFGTDDLYLGSLLAYLRTGGRLGIVAPALHRVRCRRPARAAAVLGLAVLLLPRSRVVEDALGQDRARRRRRRRRDRGRLAGLAPVRRGDVPDARRLAPRRRGELGGDAARGSRPLLRLQSGGRDQAVGVALPVHNGAMVRAERPAMRDYGVDEPGWEPLPWSWAADRLAGNRNFWVVTVSGDGRPHALPVWGVWDDGEHRFAFSCAPTPARRGTSRANPAAVVMNDDTVECVSIEGRAHLVDDRDGRRWIARYLAKYLPIQPDLDADFLRANLCLRVRTRARLRRHQTARTSRPTHATASLSVCVGVQAPCVRPRVG